jgi:hypothetical protein
MLPSVPSGFNHPAFPSLVPLILSLVATAGDTDGSGRVAIAQGTFSMKAPPPGQRFRMPSPNWLWHNFSSIGAHGDEAD